MTENSYIDTLRRLGSGKNTGINMAQKRISRPIQKFNAECSMSPKRQIVKNQKNRCYMCEKNLGDGTCNFAVIEGPDSKSKAISKEMRAVCMNCYFKLGDNPVKEVKKKIQVEREPTDKELGEMSVDEIIDGKKKYH